MYRFKSHISFLAVIFFLSSCSTIYQSQAVQYKDYRIDQHQKADSSIGVLLRPYADSVHKSMSDVIVVAAATLEKKQPEGTLGNIMADAMLIMAKQKFQAKVDAAFVNYGGIRLPSVAAGNITRGTVFEMAPFDNLIVLQHVSGKIFQQFLDYVAERKGWPCSGLSFQIKNKKAVNILIGGKPLDENADYVIANADYIANGGDDCVVLKGIPQQNNGYVFRDAILDYFAQFQKAGKALSPEIEKRITYAE